MIFDLSHLSPVVVAIGIGAFLLLVAASIIARVVLKADAQGELVKRIRSWWVMVAVVALAFVFGRGAMIVLFALVSYLALKEYLTIIPTRESDRVVLFFLYLAVPIQYYWVYLSWYGLFIIFVPVYLFLFLPAAMVIRGETKGFLRAAGTLHWGLMTSVFALSHAAYLLAAPPVASDPSAGPGLLIFLLVLTELNDVCQYIAGKSLGRTRITPTVSPKKTLEGLAGGVLATVLLAFLLHSFLTSFSLWQAGGVGLLISLSGFLGDLTMSAVKRDIGIKDAGSLIPGHGGILDRIDSLTFTAPLFFHFVRYNYG